MICKLATGEISNFKLVSVADETDLKLPLSEATKTGFVATRPFYDGYFLPFQFIWGPKQLSVCHVGSEYLHVHFVAASINSHEQTP